MLDKKAYYYIHLLDTCGKLRDSILRELLLDNESEEKGTMDIADKYLNLVGVIGLLAKEDYLPQRTKEEMSIQVEKYSKAVENDYNFYSNGERKDK